MLPGNFDKTCLNSNEFRFCNSIFSFKQSLNSKVIVPSTGKLALDMMCGEWGASRCSPKKWFEFLGDATDNMYVPFQITYITDPIDGYTPLDPLVVPCNQAVNVSILHSFDSILMLKQWIE